MKVSNNEFAAQQIRQFSRIMEEIQSNQEQISSGRRINRPSDAPVDSTRLAVADHMKSRVEQYTENTKTAESRLRRYDIAYKNATNLLSRIKELGIQAANDSSSDQDRQFIATEIEGLKANLLGIANTRDDNGQYIFGGFNSEEPAFKEQAPKSNLVHTKTGNSRVALSSSTSPPANTTTADEDIMITGVRGTRTIDVSASASAKTVAADINKVAADTGVAATAKTYAKLSSTHTSATTKSIKINGISTGNFNISSQSVSDAVTKINAITGSTGVAAKEVETEPANYVYFGSTRAALAVATSAAANTTTANEDVVITGKGAARTIDVAANDTAQQVAAKINAETANTGVTATAKTYAKLSTTDNPAVTFNIRINGVVTGNFSMANNSVGAGVAAINGISGSTGVTAEASADGTFITLYNSQGADIVFENNGSDPHLDIWAVAYDGVTVSGAKQDILAAGSNDATRIIGSISLTAPNSYTVAQSGSASTGYFATGSAGRDKYVQLYHSQGEDITVENTSSDPLLDVYALGYDGVTVSGVKQDLAPTGGNDSTRIIGNINLSSPKSYTVKQFGNEAKGYFTSGKSGLRESNEPGTDLGPKVVFSGSPGRNDVQVSETRILSVQDDGYEGFLGVKLEDGTRASVFDLIDEAVGHIKSSNDPAGIYTRTGSPRAAAVASATPANSVTAAEDIVIKIGLITHTIDVAAAESAEQVAAKVNDVKDTTGVKATAKTYAKFLSKGPVRNYSIKINGTSTGDFTISKSSVGDAVIKINEISGTTGVKAAASRDGSFIKLSNDTGADITVENESTGVDLEVSALAYDGITVEGLAQNLSQAGGADTTRVAGNIELGAKVEFSVTQNGTDSLGYFSDGDSVLSTVSARVSSSLSGLTSSLEHISQRQASIGARMQSVITQADILQNRMAVLQKDIADLRDADIAELVIELQNHLTTLEAAQLAYSKISQINLFDFLR